jgi:hypothetical protein
LKNNLYQPFITPSFSLLKLENAYIDSNDIAGIANLGWKFYLIFCAINFAFLAVLWFFYIETAGLSLEQIDRLFEIKYEGGPEMSYNEATLIIRQEGDVPMVIKGEEDVNGAKVDYIE